MAIKFSYDTLSVVETSKGGIKAIYQGQQYMHGYTGEDTIDCRCIRQKELYCKATILISRSKPHTLIRDTKCKHNHIGKSEGELYADAAYRCIVKTALDTHLKPSSIYRTVLFELSESHRRFLKPKKDCMSAVHRIRRKNCRKAPANPSELVVESDTDYGISSSSNSEDNAQETNMNTKHSQRGDEAFHSEVKTSDECNMKIDAVKEEHIQEEVLSDYTDEALCTSVSAPIRSQPEVMSPYKEATVCTSVSAPIRPSPDRHIHEEVMSQDKEATVSTSVSAPIRPTNNEFLEALKALDVVRQYASTTHGPDMGRLQTMALEMQAIGFRHIATQNTNGLI